MPQVVLRTLGTIELVDGAGRELQSILRQPKRLALLVYLAINSARGFQRRDTLIALLWPELDQEHARAALRKALFALRQELGEEAIISRGDEELRVDADVVWCDAVSLERGLEGDELAETLAIYRGELLPGFHVDGVSSDWSQWLDTERARLQARAAAGAWRLTRQREAAGDASGAREWAQCAARLQPLDESAARTLISTLDRLGDRGAAIRAFVSFTQRLRNELEIEPSPETLKLVGDLRQQAAGVRGASVARNLTQDAMKDIVVGGAVTSSEPPHAAATPSFSRRAASALVIVVVLGIAGAAWMSSKFSKDDGGDAARESDARATVAPDAPAHSIAVLPFVMLGPDSTSNHLADVVPEELINALGQSPDLRVSARTSSFVFKEKNVPVADVARALRVRHLVEGSIQQIGNRVRITVRLIDARNGYELWSRTFNRDRGEMFVLQDEISRAVARALTSGETQSPLVALSTPTPNRRAYELYLLGLVEDRKPHAAGKRRAMELLEAAIREDPQLARAHASLALNYAVGASIHGVQSLSEAREKALAAAHHALLLDSTLVAPYVALGVVHFLFDWDWSAAEVQFKRAMALNPSATSAHTYYCQVLAATGRLREAEVEMERMFALDPLSPGTNSTRGLVLHHLRRYDEAIAQYRQTLLIDSTYTNAYVFALRPLLATGRFAEIGELWHRRALQTGTIDTADVRKLVRGLGDPTSRREGVAVLSHWRSEKTMGLTNIARIYARMGERDSAIALLEDAFQKHESALYAIAAEPLFDPLRSQERFRQILRKMRLM